LTANSDARAQV